MATSRDGTAIAFDRSGQGPPVVLVAGALGDHSHPMFAQLAALLAGRFTVFNYDRRGRGDSGDTPPYAVEREVEDIDALIDEAGGSAFVYGVSSGAVLALEAASTLPTKVERLALYEPPFILDDSRPPVPGDYVSQLGEAISSGRRGEAVEIFMTKAILLPSEFLAQMRQDPTWAAMERAEHTLIYDATVMGETQAGAPLPPERVERWASATMPTLVMDGGRTEPFLHHAAETLAGVLPHAQRRTLEGQDHAVAPAALAPVLEEFFGG